MPNVKEIFVRLDRCVGCHSCELACAVEHSSGKTLFSALKETPRPRKRLYIEQVKERSVPLVCRHCEDAPCANACITGALYQDSQTRVVSHNPDKCIGCWMCTMVCPYGVIGRQKERRVAVKCDRCPDRTSPACVASCPTHALVFAGEESFTGSVRVDAAIGFLESFEMGKSAS